MIFIKYTCSIHNGTTFSQKHDCDKNFRNKESHVDENRTIDILHFENIRDFYNRFFEDSLNEYNNKQSRKDRVIENYYNHILDNKKINIGYQIIVQIGNYDIKPDDELSNKILKDYYESWKERNPNLECVSAVIHNDETTPHLHLTYVPISYENKRGLRVQVGLEKALSAQGFTSEKYHDTAQIKWQRAEQEYLISLCNSYNIEIENPKKKNQTYLQKEDYIVSKIIEKEEQILSLEQEYTDKMQIIEEKTKNRLQEVQELYNNKILEFREKHQEKIKQIEEYTNNKLLECQSLINQKVEVYKTMCSKIKQKKEELNQIIKSNKDGSIITDFKNLGTVIFGNKKIYTNEEMQFLTDKINTIESKYNYYKENQNIVHQLENQHKNEIQGLKNKLDVLRSNIQELEDENIQLKLYKDFVDTSIDNNTDFEKFKGSKIIQQEDVFGYDRKQDRYCHHKENVIVDVKELSKRKHDKEKQKETDHSLDL